MSDQESLPGFRSNPKLYRELSEPFASSEAVNEGLENFFADLGELRKKHKIRDLVVLVSLSYMSQDGTDELDTITQMEYGDAMKHEMMLAHTLGLVQAERQELIAKCLAKGIKRGGRKA